jgi:hypothetical protein
MHAHKSCTPLPQVVTLQMLRGGFGQYAIWSHVLCTPSSPSSVQGASLGPIFLVKRLGFLHLRVRDPSTLL